MSPNRSAWAVVTGASSGIGAALAEELARRGHRLMLVARRVDRLAELATGLKERYQAEVDIAAYDLADRDQRALLCADLREREVEILCNNAGFPVCGPVAGTDPAALAAELEVNVVAVQELTLSVLPAMVARGSGALLFTGSTAGMQPVPTGAVYAAGKAFVNSFAEALHVELRGTGVSCTLLAPGPVRTEFYRVGGIADTERHRWFAWQRPLRVARNALDGLERGRRVVVPGTVAKAQAFGGRYTPRTLLFPALRTVVLPRLRAPGRRPGAALTATGASRQE
ncbi:SDR family NAD(P)-dependent oxidoreductase [Nocardia sp. NPDC049526]|uniref:SDR family NAD(P)-dependent oxidoreductase n=1 Tax=Nocardia sp. NPDC049526 TaxID=3364316 RepID=UPI00379B952B